MTSGLAANEERDGEAELLELWWRSRRRRWCSSDVPGMLAKNHRNRGGN